MRTPMLSCVLNYFARFSVVAADRPYHYCIVGCQSSCIFGIYTFSVNYGCLFFDIPCHWVAVSFYLVQPHNLITEKKFCYDLLQQIGVVRDMITVCIYYMLKMTIPVDHEEISKWNTLNLWTVIQITNSRH